MAASSDPTVNDVVSKNFQPCHATVPHRFLTSRWNKSPASPKGSKSVRDEIVAQGGIKPEMTILAIFDVGLSYPMRGTYEDVITRIAYNTGWDLIHFFGDYIPKGV